MIVLASTSTYRAAQLKTLDLPFTQVKPLVDENDIKLKFSGSVKDLAECLSYEKAKAIVDQFPNALVISGDQIASIDDYILNKGETFEKTFRQLQAMQGKVHKLYTANTIYYKGQYFTHTEVTELEMRAMSDDEIKAYIELDHPLDCAGSYKFECNGHKLFTRVETKDKESIQGMCMNFIKNKLKELL